MTNGEFIISQLGAFGITDADLMIISGDVKLDEELEVSVAEKAMIPLIAKSVMAPYQKTVSEHGLSVSWDMGNIGWWYRYLCNKYGVKPDSLVESALGLSTIVDRTGKW